MLKLLNVFRVILRPLRIEHLVIGGVKTLQVAGSPHAQVIVKHVEEGGLVEGDTLSGIADINLISALIAELLLMVRVPDALLIQGAFHPHFP